MENPVYIFQFKDGKVEWMKPLNNYAIYKVNTAKQNLLLGNVNVSSCENKKYRQMLDKEINILSKTKDQQVLLYRCGPVVTCEFL